MKSIKEKQILVKWAKAMNEPVDPALVEEVERYNQLQQEIKESIRSNTINDLFDASKVAVDIITKVNIEYPKPPTLEELLSIVQEESNELVQAQATEAPTAIAEETPQPDSAPEPVTEEKPTDLISRAAEHIHKEVKLEENSFQQPNPPLVDKNIEAVQKKLKFLEQAIGKIAATGPGGGEVNLRYLDDVDRDSIVNGYVLSYDEITSKFKFVSPTAGSFTPTDVTQVFAEVKNADSITITKGQPVYLYAAIGNRASVKLAYNTGDPSSAKTLGLVYSSSISPGDTGLIITQGVVTGVDTQAYNEGDTLYLGNTAGSLTAIKPYAPNHLVYLGVVERANQGQGQIYVKPQNGYELNEIHDVSINQNVPLSNNDIIVWNSASNLWINRPISYLTQTTANVIELHNLYFTNARAVAAVTDAGISSLNNNGYALNLASDGTVSITGNIFDTGTNPATLWSNDSVTNYWRSPTGGGPGQPLNSSIKVNSSGATITLDTGVLGIGTSKTWLFGHSGNITFPDSTVQITAFNNTAIYSNVSALGYITSSALSGYATNSQLVSYATNVQLASYATISNVALKANIVDLTTSNVTEVSNLYFTNARVYTNVTQLGYITSSSLSGYATNAQLTSYATTANVALKANVADLKTANVAEVTNLYFTNARATAAVTNTLLSNISVGGYANIIFTPATTAGTALNITAANTKGGTGYADFLQVTNTSGGATTPTKWLRLDSTGQLQIINSGYTAQLLTLTDVGDMTVLGNVTSSGNKSGYSSGRPGFRVTGSGTVSGLAINQNTYGALNSNNFAVDYNQGSYLNASTGVFTAPVAGLYQIYIVGRNSGNAGYSQLAVIKNATNGTGNSTGVSGGSVACMIEWAGSSTMNHTGAGTILKLAVGDTLALKVLAGTIDFDGNDNWAVAYIG